MFAPRLRLASNNSGVKTALGLAIANSTVLLVLGVVFVCLGRSGGRILLLIGAISLGTTFVVAVKRCE
jgi:hypothetical protein